MVEPLSPDAAQELGRELVQSSLGILRTLQTHGADNAALRLGLERLVSFVAGRLREPTDVLSLQAVDQLLVLDGTRLRAHGIFQQQLTQFVGHLEERGLGGFELRGPASVEVLRGWFATLSRRATAPDEQALLWAELEAFAPRGIRPLEPKHLAKETHDDTLRVSTLAFALQSWARAVVGFREFVDALAAGRDPYRNRLNVVRVVQDLIDVAAARPDHLAWVLQLRHEREARLARRYDELHAAGTAAHAILVGELLGLERTALLDLGTAALLHGVGAALAGEDPREHEASPDAREARRLQVARALQLALGNVVTDDAIMARAAVAFEQGLPYAGPDGRPNGLHPFSRIVAVASAWDALVNDRPWRPGLAPPDAARVLREDAGTRFDPLMVEALLAAQGLDAAA